MVYTLTQEGAADFGDVVVIYYQGGIRLEHPDGRVEGGGEPLRVSHTCRGPGRQEGPDVRIDERERLQRRELRKLLPANKDDVGAIDAIRAHGYPAVQPILLDLLKWIRVESWPVAKPACEFLRTIGPRLAPQVREVLRSRDDPWKDVVLRQIVSEWPSDDVRGLSAELLLIATNGQSWGADLLALRLLAQHGIGDPEWITAWLEFKRDHHEKRLSEIAEILHTLRDRGTA
jgi:hypothetical protein